MKFKMPWLKAQLRQMNSTTAALAAVLDVAPPRVYEMIGGRRGIQPTEIVPMAQFLGWTVDHLMKHLPPEARVMPVNDFSPPPRTTATGSGEGYDPGTRYVAQRRCRLHTNWRDDTLLQKPASV